MIWAAALGALVACSGGNKTAATAPISRVETVAVTQQGQEKDLDAFCEVRKDAATAPAFSLPTLDSPEPPRAQGWTWYSLWATWCVPCVAEMGLLKTWDAKLKAEGANASVRLVSVDAAVADVQRFQAAHADMMPTLRVAKQESVAGWLASMGLDAAASIPIHVFVDPQGKTRCVRVGAISEADYPTIKYLVTR